MLLVESTTFNSNWNHALHLHFVHNSAFLASQYSTTFPYILISSFSVYFHQLYGAKLVELLFSAILTFFVLFKPFSVISCLKSIKNIWNWTKNYICLLLKAGQLMREYLQFVFFRLIFLFIFKHFCWFQAWNQWKKQKRLKTAEKK